MKLTKIARRLILYFSVALVLFSLIVGGAFSIFSARRTMDMHRKELQTKAENVASSMYGFLSGTAPAMGNGAGSHKSEHSGNSLHGTGYGAYMRFLDQLVMADVWVVDSDSMTITPSSEHHMDVIEYGELPPDGEEVIDRALLGETAFSEGFSGFWEQPTLTVGVPIRKDADSEPLGAVLLHTPVSGISDAVLDSLNTMLLSLLPALLLSILAGILLSLRFTRPLSRMQDTAARLAEGDLNARNRVYQNDEIGQLARSMDSMADRLEAASREREQQEQARLDFFSNISHELRTPVTVLRGSLEALTDGIVTDPGQVKEYQNQMLAESKHLQRLVDDLLELSRLQNADFQIEKTSLDLRQLLDDVARSMRRVAEPKAVALEIQAENREFPFLGDYGRLRQMLIATADNAVKFSPEGGTVRFSLSQEERGPKLAVTDHGPGISPELLPYIFQRFRTSGGDANSSGTGLGLPIVQQIALRHGVEIRVESRPGETSFIFLFPRKKQS